MDTAPLRVVLLTEITLLGSALAQVLAGDPRLVVEVHPPGEECEVRAGLGRLTADAVGLVVLDDPLQHGPPLIELHAENQVWVLEYRGLERLVALLGECHHGDVAHAVRRFRE